MSFRAPIQKKKDLKRDLIKEMIHVGALKKENK